MEYQCSINIGGKKEQWPGQALPLRHSGPCYEAEMTGRGTYFHVIAGASCHGNYICIPNHDIGSKLSDFNDIFWNTERLSRFMGKVDAVTVAYGLCHLKELIYPGRDSKE